MEKETKTRQEDVEEEVPLSLKPQEANILKEKNLARYCNFIILNLALNGPYTFIQLYCQ
jgi:hypothetical protein